MSKEINSIQKHPISFTENFKPNNEYTIKSFIFTDSKGEKSDGCVFEIKPRGSTRIMKIIDENLECQRIAIEGSGWCLRTNLNDPNHEVEVYELNADDETNPLIELCQGWVDCFIAGDDGMEVADISTPKFDPKMEKNIPDNSSELPEFFWTTYKELKQIS